MEIKIRNKYFHIKNKLTVVSKNTSNRRNYIWNWIIHSFNCIGGITVAAHLNY